MATSVSGLDADVKGAWSKRRYEAYQCVPTRMHIGELAPSISVHFAPSPPKKCFHEERPRRPLFGHTSFTFMKGTFLLTHLFIFRSSFALVRLSLLPLFSFPRPQSLRAIRGFREPQRPASRRELPRGESLAPTQPHSPSHHLPCFLSYHNGLLLSSAGFQKLLAPPPHLGVTGGGEGNSQATRAQGKTKAI